jgi:RecA/RadA recombinase
MANEKTKVSEKPSAYSPDYLDVLSKCEKVAKVQSLTLSTEDRLSTGLLGLDGILGGGITAGMYTFFGPEQSAKTTAAITIAGASIHQDVGLRILWDAENSSGSSTDYISNIFNTLKVKTDVESVFGVKKDGKYFVKPQIYYRDEGEAEKYFDYLAALLRRLPNKRYEDKRWWFVYPRDKEHLAQFGSVMDKKMSSMNDAIYIPAKNGALQGLIVVDSYPSLVPSEADEDDASGALALQARTFSQGLQRIKGKLRAKRFAIVGINQLRTAPMVRFGSPMSASGFKTAWARAMAKAVKAGVESFAENDLRAKVAGEAMELGQDAASMLGHSTDAVTRRHYIRGTRKVAPLR